MQPQKKYITCYMSVYINKLTFMKPHYLIDVNNGKIKQDLMYLTSLFSVVIVLIGISLGSGLY